MTDVHETAICEGDARLIEGALEAAESSLQNMSRDGRAWECDTRVLALVSSCRADATVSSAAK